MNTQAIKQNEPSGRVHLEPLLTIDDLVRVLRVNKRTVRRMWERCQLPSPFKVGGSNRWKADDIVGALDVLGHGGERRVENEMNLV